MSLILRICLVIVSILTFVVIIRKIRASKVQIETSLFWILFAIGLLVLSFFPELAYLATELLQIQAPVNFIFLFFIFILLIHQFYNSIKLSELENKLKELTQELAIRELIVKTDPKENTPEAEEQKSETKETETKETKA